MFNLKKIYFYNFYLEKELLKNESYLFLSTEDINNNNIENKIKNFYSKYQSKNKVKKGKISKD